MIEGHPQLTSDAPESRGAATPAPGAAPAVPASESAPAAASGAAPAAGKAPAVHAGHMKLLFENAPVAMAMFDQQMRYLLANRRWLEDFKLTQVDVVGRSQYELFPALHAGWRHVYERALGGQVVRSDRDAMTQDGRPVVYRWEVRPWRHIDTSIGGVMISCEHLYANPGGSERVPQEEAARVDSSDPGAALWQASLPLMALDAEGRILRMSRDVSSQLLSEGVVAGETPMWEAFGEKIERGSLQQHVLATIKSVLEGDHPHAVINVYGDAPGGPQNDDAPPDRWLVSRAPGGVLGMEGDAVLAVGLAGLSGLEPRGMQSSVVPPPASVIFGETKLPPRPAPVVPTLAPSPPAPTPLPTVMTSVLAPAPALPPMAAPLPQSQVVAAVDEAVQRRLAEEVARMRMALKEATDSEGVSRQREARLRAVLELAPCGLLVLDERARPLYCNAHLHLLLGRPLADGRTMEEWLAEACRDEAHREQVLLQWREGIWRKQLTLAMALVSAEGVVKDIEIRPVSLPGGGLLAMLQDVTDTRRSEEMLRSTEAKFRTLVHENPLPVLLADRLGAIFDANPAAETLLGYTRAELRRMRLDRWLDAESVTRRASTLRDLLERGERSAWTTVTVVPREGDTQKVDLRLAIVPDALGQPLFTIHFFQPKVEPPPVPAPVMDWTHPLFVSGLSAPATAGDVQPEFAPAPPAPVEYRPLVLLTTDVHGRISDWSPEAVEQFGFEETEVTGRGLHCLFRPSDATGFYGELSSLPSDPDGEGHIWAFYHRDKGRQEGVFKIQKHPEDGDLSISLLKDLPASVPGVADAAGHFTADPGHPGGLVPVGLLASASAQDHGHGDEIHADGAGATKVRIPASAFAARVAAPPEPPAPAKPNAEELKRERIILGESYRRVKNHLQIITSMLNLQLSTLRNEEARDALRSSQNRVRSLAALHQHLYALASGESSGFQAFAEGLISHLRDCYGVAVEQVQLDLRVQDELLPEDWLMPLALSLNEMVSNAFQHAYGDGRAGQMTVELHWDELKAHLLVKDDGVGMSPDFDDHRGNGLGMKILRVFAGQLGGEVKVQGQPGEGASFHLEFPVSDAPRS
ncbi:PAS domain S-box protein [Verrucomicrobium sp. BvORR106]|uniref:PAS domain S-box protein n=1 Tax=Verrucomicrobium sp. BvORR106 TaxID=1403819 RepID=UPI000B28B202|nr:PAS domain S-box protein [Verrucomicrobium sp. BvORR106]